MDFNTQAMIDMLTGLLRGTGWTWDDPRYPESGVICPCGNKLEIDAEKCYCGRTNPVPNLGIV